MEVTMPMLTIRNDLTAEELRRLARRERDARVGRRMLAIANALDGMSRAMAAKLAGMDRQTLRDWVIRYNERGVPGLCDRWGPGRPTAVDDGQLAVVKAAILQAASRAGDAKPALRIVDVAALIEERTGVNYSISRTGSCRLWACRIKRPGPATPRPTRRHVSVLKKSPGRAEADRA
jgi:transposase